MKATGLRIASVIALLCAAPQAFAYVEDGIVWPDGSITMTMTFSSPDRTLIDGSTSWQQPAIVAMNAWNTHMTRTQLVPLDRPTATPARRNGTNNVFFSPTIYGETFDTGVLAVTLRRTNGINWSEGDVIFNANRSYDSYRGNLRAAMDFQRVAIHEFGHVIGLDHPDEAGQQVSAIMNSIVSNRDTLAADDISGAVYLYATDRPVPTLTQSLVGQSIELGQPVEFRTESSVDGSTFGWEFRPANSSTYETLLNGDGNPWEGPVYRIAATQTIDAGSYRVRAATLGGVSAASTASLTVRSPVDPAPRRLVNISTRGRVSLNNELIAGFVIGGSTPKQLLIRAAGPSLKQFKVSGTLARAGMILNDKAGNQIAADAGIEPGESREAAIAVESRVGAFPLGVYDAELLVTLQPGTYTTVVRSFNNDSGVALVEVYDADESEADANSRPLINLSTRGYVGTNDDRLIAGFYIAGSSAKRLLLRAIGPGLEDHDVSNFNSDTNMVLYRDSDPLDDNDDWAYSKQTALLPGIFDQVGAFQLAEGSYDSALIATLPPGGYTIVVDGRSGEVGIALVEVYELPEE